MSVSAAAVAVAAAAAAVAVVVVAVVVGAVGMVISPVIPSVVVSAADAMVVVVDSVFAAQLRVEEELVVSVDPVLPVYVVAEVVV